MKGFSDLVWAALGAINKLARPVWLGGTPRTYMFTQLLFNKSTVDLRVRLYPSSLVILG